MKNELEKIVSNATLRKWADVMEGKFLRELEKHKGGNGQIGVEKVAGIFSQAQIESLNVVKGMCEK